MPIIPERFAVMTLDPGGVSGVARGIFEARETLKATLLDGGELEAWEVEGEPELQAFEIAEEFKEWSANLMIDGFCAANDISLVCESFALRQRSADLSPVEVRSALRALLMPPVDARQGVMRFDHTWVEQSPGDAKSIGTPDRLKGWNLYRLGRGSDHKRDALRHLVLRVNRVLGQMF